MQVSRGYDDRVRSRRSRVAWIDEYSALTWSIHATGPIAARSPRSARDAPDPDPEASQEDEQSQDAYGARGAGSADPVRAAAAVLIPGDVRFTGRHEQ